MNEFEEWLQHNWLVNKLDPHEKQIAEEAWNAALIQAMDYIDEYDENYIISQLCTKKELKYD